MYNFGEYQKDAWMNFGVAGLLQEKCRVYYDSIFGVRHAGKVSDLLCAKLQSKGVDALQLRALLLYNLFEAYRAQASSDSSEPLRDPMVLECGIDDEKIAVAVSFHLPETLELDEQRLVRSMAERSGTNPFEKLLVHLGDHAHWVVLKFDPRNRRIEIAAIHALPQKAGSPGGLTGERSFAFVRLSGGEAVARAAEFTQLADLDHAGLLVDESRPGANPQSESSKRSVKPGSKTSETRQRVRGAKADGDSQTVVEGDEPGASEAETVKVAGGLNRLLKKVWPFGKKDTSPTQDAEPPTQEPSAKPERDSDSLVEELQNVAEPKSLKPAVVEEVRKEMGTDRARRWMDGLMAELAAERLRITELAKTAASSVRLKDLELRNKESLFQKELQEKEQALRQKENALIRAKEQIAQGNVALEQLKASGHGGTEELVLKQRLTQAQNALNTAKEENAHLKSKIDELRAHAASADAAKVKTQAMNEVSTVQSKLVRSQRQVEDLKRANQQLTEKLAEAQKASEAASGDAELKGRLEAAMKMVSNANKQNERLSANLEKLRKEEAKAKSDLQEFRRKYDPHFHDTPPAGEGGEGTEAA